MQIILKIIAAPFIVLLTLLWAILTFLFCIAEKVMGIAAGLALLIAIVLFVIGQLTGGIVFIAIAFLISPVGISLFVGWLIEKLGELNYSLKAFIMS